MMSVKDKYIGKITIKNEEYPIDILYVMRRRANGRTAGGEETEGRGLW
jgi:hypothetical protein